MICIEFVLYKDAFFITENYFDELDFGPYWLATPIKKNKKNYELLVNHQTFLYKRLGAVEVAFEDAKEVLEIMKYHYEQCISYLEPRKKSEKAQEFISNAREILFEIDQKFLALNTAKPSLSKQN